MFTYIYFSGFIVIFGMLFYFCRKNQKYVTTEDFGLMLLFGIFSWISVVVVNVILLTNYLKTKVDWDEFWDKRWFDNDK